MVALDFDSIELLLFWLEGNIIINHLYVGHGESENSALTISCLEKLGLVFQKAYKQTHKIISNMYRICLFLCEFPHLFFLFFFLLFIMENFKCAKVD